MDLFLSHRMDSLVDRLIEQFDANPIRPLEMRTILVPNGQMKQWLLLEIAKRQGIAMGLRIESVDEGMFQKNSPLQIFCHIYNAVRESTDPELQGYLDGKKGRLLTLTSELSALFFTYGQYGESLFDPDCEPIDWQHAIVQKLFVKGPFRMPVQTVGEVNPGRIHCFGIDYLPALFWAALFRAPSLSIYLFSPCIDYWEDLCSDQERRNLNRYWKKRKATEASRKQLDAYLRDAPPLLANWGKLGREALKILDRFDLQTEEVYPNFEPDSLLKKVQYDLLLFQNEPKSVDDSIKIFMTGSSRLKEIECLRDEILRLKVPFYEISVLAPDIEPYVPLIEFVFRDIPYRISGFDLSTQSSFRQGLIRLLDLTSGRWEAEDVLTLFETPAFYRKQGLDEDKLEQFRSWIKYARIRWGLDASHKTETLGRVADDDGSWEKGLDRLLDTIVYLKAVQINPDQLEEFIEIITRLKNLSVRGEKTLAAWADSLEMIAKEFLQADLNDEADMATLSAFSKSLRDLRAFDGDCCFPLSVVQHLLIRPAFGQIHTSHLHAVRFAPLEEAALLPAKALFLIGMDEESFPRMKLSSSLDLLKRQKISIPEKADRDRYLFLQALFSAEEFLRISYGHLSADEGKPVNCSLLVQELMNSTGLSGTLYRSPSLAAPKNEISFWHTFNNIPLPQGEMTISISDLRLLARHPWKFYLQKVHAIYLNESLEESFALKKGQLIHATFEKPVEQVLEEAELPPGPLGEALRLEIIEKAEEIREQLNEWELSPFSLQLRENCTQKQAEGGDWVAPPIELTWEHGLKVKLVGEIRQATQKGLICSHEDNVAGVLKVWPEALALAMALDAPQIWILKNGKSKNIENPEQGLKSFIEYYFRSQAAPSPLLGDWADILLRKGAQELEKKIQKGFTFDDPVIDWVMARTEIPTAQEIMSGWGPYLKETFSNLAALYPARSKSHGSV